MLILQKIDTRFCVEQISECHITKTVKNKNKKYLRQINKLLIAELDNVTTMTEIVRYRLRFYGIVQGVGFRFTAAHAADLNRLTGYVKNEYDGSVTCEVQGDEETVERFIATIINGRFIQVDNIDRTRIDVIPDERSFERK